MKRVKWTAVGIVATLACAVVLVLAIGIPSYAVNRTVRSYLSGSGYVFATNRAATFELWPRPAIVLRDVSLSEKAGETAKFGVAVASATIEASWSSILDGAPRVTQIRVVDPVIRAPLVFGDRQSGQSRNVEPIKRRVKVPALGRRVRILAKNASVLVIGDNGKVATRLDHLDLRATLKPASGAEIAVAPESGSKKFRLKIITHGKAEASNRIPVDLSLSAPGILRGVLTAKAGVRWSGESLEINDLVGQIRRNSFKGAVSVDFTGDKPLVKGRLNFTKLALESGRERSSGRGLSTEDGKGWGERPIDLDWLSFLNMQWAITAKDLDFGRLSLSPTTIEGVLSDGVLYVAVSDTGLYGGRCSGTLIIDANHPVPKQSIHLKVSSVQALPFLSAIANFHALDGITYGDIDAEANGRSERAIISSLGGDVEARVVGGEIRGVDLGATIQSLTQRVSQGWHQTEGEKTDLSEFRMQGTVKNGQLSVSNLRLRGPLIAVNGMGNVDLAQRRMHLKLHAGLNLDGSAGAGNGSATDFGVPVIVDGKWTSPRIYPDVAGIFDDPATVYSKLHELGLGLFGADVARRPGSAGGIQKNGSGGSGTAPVVNNLLQGIVGK